MIKSYKIIASLSIHRRVKTLPRNNCLPLLFSVKLLLGIGLDVRLLISQNFLLSAKFKRSLNILSTAFEMLPPVLVFDDFRLPLNFCACELLAGAAAVVVGGGGGAGAVAAAAAAAADAAANAFNEAAIDALFNCFDKLDEWCSADDVVRFLTSADASSLDGVSPVLKQNEQQCI